MTLIISTICFYVSGEALSALAIVFVSTIVFYNCNSIPKDTHSSKVSNSSLIIKIFNKIQHTLTIVHFLCFLLVSIENSLIFISTPHLNYLLVPPLIDTPSFFLFALLNTPNYISSHISLLIQFHDVTIASVQLPIYQVSTFLSLMTRSTSPLTLH